jgi:hypothetical protein
MSTNGNRRLAVKICLIRYKPIRVFWIAGIPKVGSFVSAFKCRDPKQDNPKLTIEYSFENIQSYEDSENIPLQYPNLKKDQSPIVWYFEFRSL